jgi:hypothetical protein
MESSAEEATGRLMPPSKAHDLDCHVRVPAELSAVDRQRMYHLMTDYYESVELSDFERDLSEKEWAILMTDSRGEILGFTTLMRLTAQCGDEQLVALFSGDTVLDRDIWGAAGWVREWGHLAEKLMSEMHPLPLYWLLLTATHRTYRFLPACFKQYYPRAGVATPPNDQRRLDALVKAKFPKEYDASRGIVRTYRPMSVRQESVEMATRGVAEEHAAFFAERNPGFLRGDYLVCITDLTFPNRTRLGTKLISLAAD